MPLPQPAPQVRTRGAKAMLFPLLGLSLLMVCPRALAIDLPLTAPQLDAMLKLSFPLSYDSGPYHIVLSDPHVRFYGSRRRMGINARVLITGPKGHHLAGRGTVSGALRFDRKQQSLQLVRPELNKLHVDSVSPDLAPALKEARSRLQGQPLPLIVLLDVHQLERILPVGTINDVRVGKHALIISF